MNEMKSKPLGPIPAGYEGLTGELAIGGRTASEPPVVHRCLSIHARILIAASPNCAPPCRGGLGSIMRQRPTRIRMWWPT